MHRAPYQGRTGAAARDAIACHPDPSVLSIRANVGNANAPYYSFVPDFHFIAPNGNAAVLHRELVATTGRYDKTLVDNEVINIPAAAQREGAMISGGWRCGSARYSVTIRAYVIDTEGDHSNSIDYTFHCNGG